MTLSIKRSVNAERFNSHGSRVEDVSIDVSVTPNGQTVFLHVNGEKRSQRFALLRTAWDELVPLTPKWYGRTSFAVCREHSGEALVAMAGLPVYVKPLTKEHHEYYHCTCKAPAEFLLIELSGRYEEHGSRPVRDKS